jgi:hypothetical protein
MARSPMRSIRTVFATFLVLFLAGFTLVGTSGSASAAQSSAADSYRYWMYSSVIDGEFTTYDVGVGGSKPKDGTIEAYRYASSADYPPHVAPRADLEKLTFDAICGHVDAADGQKRVGVLVDFGEEFDAAEGEEPPAPFAGCAQVPTNATGLQVLQSVADVRTEKSSSGPLLCGIDGYPAAKCSLTVSESTPADSGTVDFAIKGVGDDAETDDDDGSNMPMLLGIGAVVVLLGAGGVALNRRNKS